MRRTTDSERTRSISDGLLESGTCYAGNEQHSHLNLMGRSIRLIVFLPTLYFMGCFLWTNQSDDKPERLLLRYVCDTADEIDTFEGYIVKDLQAGGAIRADFKITPSDSARILEKLLEIYFFDMRSPHPSFPWNQKPSKWPNSLRVTFGGQEKHIEWDNYDGTFSPLKELHELREFLLNTTENTAEWEALPPARHLGW